MTRTRDLDYAPLARRAGLRSRVRAMGANNVLVIAGVVVILVVAVSSAVFVGLLVTGNATDVGGLLVLAMCFGGGVYALLDLSRRSGVADAFSGFAEANGLTLVRGSSATQYAGSLFADGSHAVYQSVRTEEPAFVEVGERLSTETPRSRHDVRRPELFLRARLAGSMQRSAQAGELVSGELDAELRRFAGTYSVEVSGDELTLFGSRGLEAGRSGRMETAFSLADQLVASANARLVPSEATAPTSVAPAATHADDGGRRPLTVIGWTLALLVGGPLVVAIIMSVLDDVTLGDEPLARLVVSLLVVGVLAVAAMLVRRSVTSRRDR